MNLSVLPVAASLLLIAVSPFARASTCNHYSGICRYDEDAENCPDISPLLRPGEGDRNVSLAVHCTQRGAELTWNDGGLSNDVHYIMVVSLCINATSTLQEPDYEKIHDGDGTYLQTTSSSIPAQTGSICSFFGCYANTVSGPRTWYTFDTLTCNWATSTTSAGFATIPTSTPHLRGLSSSPTVSASSPAPHSTLAPSADATLHSLPDSGTPTVLTTTNAVQPTLSTAVPHSTAMPASPAHTMEDATTQLETRAATGIRGSTSIKIRTQSLTSTIVLATTHTGIPTSHPDPVGRSLSTVSPFVWAIPAVVMLIVITAIGLLIAGICAVTRRSTSKFQEFYLLDQKIDLNYYPVNIIDPPSLKKTVSITSLASTVLNSLQWTSGSTATLSDSDTDNTSTTDKTHKKSIVTDISDSINTKRDPDETESKDSETGPDGYMNTTLQPNQNTESEAGYMISSVDANDLHRPTEGRTSTGADSSEELHETHSQWPQVDPSTVAQTSGQSGYVNEQKAEEPVAMNIEDSTPAVDIWDLYSESEKSDSEDSFVEIQLDSECEDAMG